MEGTNWGLCVSSSSPPPPSLLSGESQAKNSLTAITIKNVLLLLLSWILKASFQVGMCLTVHKRRVNINLSVSGSLQNRLAYKIMLATICRLNLTDSNKNCCCYYLISFRDILDSLKYFTHSSWQKKNIFIPASENSLVWSSAQQAFQLYSL